MPSADKRARKKENARAAREQREAAVRRKKRLRSSLTIGIVVAIFVAGRDPQRRRRERQEEGGVDDHDARDHATGPTCVKTVPAKPTKQNYKAAPPMTIDTAKTYTAHISTTCGDLRRDARREGRTQDRHSFMFLANADFYDGSRCTGSSRTS